MKLKELLDNLNRIAAKNPETLEMTVIYRNYDEIGEYSEYSEVVFKQEAGKYKEGNYSCSIPSKANVVLIN